ncbi:MAG TPA: hypothetical protein VFX82_10980, partial [Desulfobacterales bacterium]|nr:hypothetical protein [Desulfobacterales bacterium]
VYILRSGHPEKVDCGSGQGRSDFARRRRSEATPKSAKSEIAGMGRKTPFMDGHQGDVAWAKRQPKMG